MSLQTINVQKSLIWKKVLFSGNKMKNRLQSKYAQNHKKTGKRHKKLGIGQEIFDICPSRRARPSIDGRLSNTASAPLLALFNVLGPGGLD